MLDEMYFATQSKSERSAAYLRRASEGETVDRLKDIKLRLQALYERLIEGEICILDSVVAYYDVYYGPFREQRSSKLTFEKTRGGKRVCSRVTSLFHAFAVEYSSVLDAIIKLLLTLANENVPPRIRRCASYGAFTALLRGDARTRSMLEIHTLLGPWLAYEGLMTSVKDRRDLTIHDRYFILHPSSARTSSGYLEMEFWSPEVYRSGRTQFDVKETILLRYNYFCRAALYALLRLLNQSLSNLLEHARHGSTR